MSFTSRESWRSSISFSSAPAPITSCTAPRPIRRVSTTIARSAGGQLWFFVYLTKSSLIKPGPAMISGPDISAMYPMTWSKKAVQVVALAAFAASGGNGNDTFGTILAEPEQFCLALFKGQDMDNPVHG